MLPRQADSFQDRGEVGALDAALAGGGTAVVCQVLAGMGGVGKTQLAARYARHALASGGVDLLVWVTATTRTAIVDAYAQAAQEILHAGPDDPGRAAEAFLAWLEPRPGAERRRWLVVLDDVADPADLRGLWPPASPSGHTLVTTRRQDAALTGHGRRLVRVGQFTPAEATAYLTTALAAHDRHESPGELAALAADLGHLPLALAQAAAYLTDTGLGAAGYRGLLADRARRLPELLPDPGSLPDDQTVTATAAWSLSLDRADQLRPAGLARPMLELTAMLDPNGIPTNVLTSAPALAHLMSNRTAPGGGQEPPPVTAREAVGALRTLHRLSLVDHTPGTPHQAVRVHQLIQRATRDSLTPDRHHQLARTTADALTAAWPAIERDTDLGQALRANTTTLAHCAEDALYRPATHRVLFRTGTSLGETGQAGAAATYYRNLTDTTRRRLGPDHHDTLAARQSLVQWQGRAGDAGGAAAGAAELLADCLRVLGPDHHNTLIARHGIAYWRGKAGDAPGAIAAFTELLADCLRVFGPDHDGTFAARHGLAEWRGQQGDPGGATAEFAELAADCLRVLGPDNPHTLITRADLAYWRGEAGDGPGAAAAYAELLADQVRVLGPDHPDTLAARGRLARLRGDAGDAPGAVVAYAELLADRVRVLGPDHPDTLAARHRLARLRGDAGDAHGAAAAHAELLADRVRVLGPDHPDTLITRDNLAYLQGRAGDAHGAATAYTELLADCLRVLGPDHAHTLAARGSLAYWRGRAGDAHGAVAAYAELLADRVRVLGPDHPDTLATRRGLARWRGDAGDAHGAAAAYAELLADRVRVLGPDHPDALATRDNLAYWQRKTHGGVSLSGNDRSRYMKIISRLRRPWM
ncbi:tetratricopeptide repeat protein [Streptomyces sp. NPDC001868]|uniref:tetratricopeptide repeat protein n=1 Tax=Streptomyces sp. NPDC001868 TaxID=3154401 RepID=UPI0033345A62